MSRISLVLWLIFYSLRYRTRPWNFFQINHHFFNGKKNIFSKQELNDIIPDRWRLRQIVDDGLSVLDFPLFVKPEWGQNSHGVSLVENNQDLLTLRGRRRSTRVDYLLQEAAPEEKEYEIFYLRRVDRPQDYALLSVTETVNSSSSPLPVNGIHNQDCCYLDRTGDFSVEELQKIWGHMMQIGCFGIARVGVKADSQKGLVDGYFHVIEINIFLPMPLVLLDSRIGWRKKHGFVRKSMKAAARLAAAVEIKGKRHPIFFRKLIAHYKVNK